MSAVRTLTRLTVYARDWDACARCGKALGVGNRQCQHRVPRGMGGRVDHDRLSALILLCGFSSTDPQGCHYAVESRRLDAERDGFLVPEGTDPTEWPVRYSAMHGGGLWLLDDEGDRRRVA